MARNTTWNRSFGSYCTLYIYIYNIQIHYIPGTLKQGSDYICASRKETDEVLKIYNAKIIHEGSACSRLDKVINVVEYFNTRNIYLPFRVCYMDKGDKLNCCSCEKCYRTILELISIREDPEKFGFKIDSQSKMNLLDYYKHNDLNDIKKDFYVDIKKQIKNNKKNIKFKYRWVKKIDFKIGV